MVLVLGPEVGDPNAAGVGEEHLFPGTSSRSSSGPKRPSRRGPSIGGLGQPAGAPGIEIVQVQKAAPVEEISRFPTLLPPRERVVGSPQRAAFSTDPFGNLTQRLTQVAVCPERPVNDGRAHAQDLLPRFRCGIELAVALESSQQVVLSRASTKHTSGAEQKCTTREVIGQRKCPRQLFGRSVTEAGWQQAGRVSE